MEKEKKTSGRKLKILVSTLFLVTTLGLLIPQHFKMPVAGATSKDYHPDSFWYYPWGRSVTHKGVDIFAKTGTPIYSATPGIVVYRGELAVGGKIVLVLGPQWRLHLLCPPEYYRNLHLCLCGSQQDHRNGRNNRQCPWETGTSSLYPAYINSLSLVDRQLEAGLEKVFILDPIPYLEVVPDISPES